MLFRRTLLTGCTFGCRAHSRSFSPSQSSRTSPKLPSTPTDALGLPLFPTWSVHDLIRSYPSPTLSHATLTRLHELAALVPPTYDTPEFEQLKREIQDLVRLVEAVRMAPEGPCDGECHSDGRVWPAGRNLALDSPGGEQGRSEPPSGQALLEHARRTKNGFYLVDSAKPKA